jgi:hypothetical protein
MWDGKYIFRLSSATWLIVIYPAAKFTIHLLTATDYGYFVDELYTIIHTLAIAKGET